MVSFKNACLNNIVLLNFWPVGPTEGLSTTMSNSSERDAIMRPMRSLKRSSLRPVSKMVRVCGSSLESRHSSTTVSFQHPFHARGSSMAIPSPQAARMSGLCHQPPSERDSWACRKPTVDVFQSCLLGRGDEKTSDTIKIELLDSGFSSHYLRVLSKS